MEGRERMEGEGRGREGVKVGSEGKGSKHMSTHTCNNVI